MRLDDRIQKSENVESLRNIHAALTLALPFGPVGENDEQRKACEPVKSYV